MILAIDPGTEESAFVGYDPEAPGPVCFYMQDNRVTVVEFAKRAWQAVDVRVVEWIESYGMPVGREVFETVYWIGRFDQAFGPLHRVTRRQVKLHLCNSPRANDATIRQALIDRFGGTKARAIGCKASPGPLYGIKGDLWSALAVAVTFAECGAKIAKDFP